MKRFAGLVGVVLAAAVLIASCSKDKVSGSLTFDSPAVFLQPGGEIKLGFNASNVSGYSITSRPDGWNEPVVDAAARTITIVAPVTFDDDVLKSGSLVMTGTVDGGSVVSASLFVGVVDVVDMSAQPANSYLVSEKETNYLFDATKKGDGSSLATASVGVVWQSQSSLIQYLDLRDGKASFYVGADTDADHIKEGNAVIGAYDSDGTLIWSWHVWASDYDPEAADGSVNFNGYTMMTRNLGALAQSNSSTADILASYGLYYQWGRKDPFIGPATYNAGNGSSASMYNGGGSRVYLKTAVSSAETGTLEYAVRNPLTFIVGVPGSEYDWLWSAHSDGLWPSDNNVGMKTVNDPCPYGWRVAPSGAFAGLSIKETLEGVGYEPYYDKFGWTLTDGGAESLFIGAGRRIYRHTQENDTKGGGSIQNFYPTPVSPAQVRSEALYNQPWVGYYWTTAPLAATRSAAFYFWFNKSDVAASGVENSTPQYRANGMSVRCVKVQSR